MTGWIEKQMDAERKTSRYTMTIMGAMSGFFALLLCYLALTPLIDGVYRLDTAEKVKRFSQGNYMDGVLTYRASLDTMGEEVITESRGGSLNVFMNGGYIEAPLQNSPEEKTYRVWRLAGEGYTVLYLTQGAFEDTGEVHVQAQYPELNRQIIRDFAPNGDNIHVLYDAGSPLPYLSMTAFFALAAVILLLLRRSNALRRRTALARQIAALGDYAVITEDINRQAEKPLFDSPGVTILRDWVLIRSNYAFQYGRLRTMAVPARNIVNIAISKDEDDGSMYACAFSVRNADKPLTVYLDSKRAAELETVRRDFLNP